MDSASLSPYAQYADLDGDGRPDHVVGGDGQWHPFDPHTGEMLDTSSESAPSPTEAYRTPVGPTGLGGGGAFGGPAPPPPSQPPSAPAPSAPPIPEMPNHSESYDSGGGQSAPYLRTQSSPSMGGGFWGESGHGSSGGGGGGSPSPMYSALRAKGNAMAGKVRSMASGMGSGGSSYGGSSSGYSSSSSAGKPTLFDQPPDPRMRGLARGMDPQQAEALFSHPTTLLPRYASRAGIPPESTTYEILSNYPTSEVAMLLNSRRVPTERNTISQMVNRTGDLYGQLASGDFPSRESMIRGLITAKPKSALGQLMVPPRPEPVQIGYTARGKPLMERKEPDYDTSPLQTATTTLQNTVHAINLASGMAPDLVDAWDRYASYLIDQQSASQLRREPSKMKPLNKRIGRELQNG